MASMITTYNLEYYIVSDSYVPIVLDVTIVLDSPTIPIMFIYLLYSFVHHSYIAFGQYDLAVPDVPVCLMSMIVFTKHTFYCL